MARVDIERTSLGERVLHWMTALSFLYCFLSGLGIAFPKLKWLLEVLGGGEFSAWLHRWSGVIFVFCVVRMYLWWRKDMRMSDDDRTWLANVKYYVSGRSDKLPETGKYNAGQKVYAWIVFLASPLLVLSGLLMWFPEAFPKTFARYAVLVHELVFIGIGSGFIVHFYMGTIGLPGTLSSMITGRVSAAWAQSHHRKWFKEITKRAG